MCTNIEYEEHIKDPQLLLTFLLMLAIVEIINTFKLRR